MTPSPLFRPALQAIDAALQGAGGPVLAAVDGRCAAGKTTFAALCAQVFPGCAALHMDDFFLPPERRLPARLAQPGGNVDYERVEAEVLAPISRGEGAVYRPFRCADNTLSGPVALPLGRLTLVEGSYALHPALAGYYQVRLFLTCDPQVQLARLARREPPEKLAQFQARWIPLEERYFSALRIPETCHVVVDTSPLAPENPPEQP